MLEQEHEDSQQFSKAQYVISYTAAEFSRLNQQADLVTNAEGGICPELEDLSGIQTLFDAACGPGSWAIMAADLYPDIHVIGGDIHPQYLVHARERAQRLGLSNIDFHTIDITKTLPFADDSVDLANARFIQSVLTKEVWLSFLKEMVRIVRPGGFIRLTEGAFVESNSLPFNRIQAFIMGAENWTGG